MWRTLPKTSVREYQPTIRAEVYRGLKASERHLLFDLLAGNGYEVFRYKGGARPLGPLVERDRMTAEKHFDVLAVPKQRRNRLAA